MPCYAEKVVRTVFPEPLRPTFVWASDRCTPAYDPEKVLFCHSSCGAVRVSEPTPPLRGDPPEALLG